MAYRISIFYNVLSLCHIIDKDLMTGRSVLEQRDALAVDIYHSACCERLQADYYRVSGIDFQK